MTQKSLLIATLLFAVAGPALAQQGQMPATGATQVQGQRPSPFERADSNRDGVITLEEVRIARTAAFTRLDANRDGFLLREEMPPPPQAHRGQWAPDMRMSGIEPTRSTREGGGINYTTADKNSDGTITRAEFDAAWTEYQASKAASVTERQNRMFTNLDANNDGGISLAERTMSAERRRDKATMRVAPAQGAGTQSPAQAAQARYRARPPMSNLDTNNDQKISLAEWLARPDPLFERGDANKDGRVTREEAAAIVRQGRGEGRGEGGRPKRPW